MGKLLFGLVVVVLVVGLYNPASTHIINTIPHGAVVAFERTTCPPGWTAFAPAFGRFIRGIDLDGDTDPDGQRVPGSVQNDSFAAHSHTRPKDVHDAGGGRDSSWVAHGKYFGYGHTNAPPTGKAGGTETRPDNVALLYCKKQ